MVSRINNECIGAACHNNMITNINREEKFEFGNMTAGRKAPLNLFVTQSIRREQGQMKKRSSVRFLKNTQVITDRLISLSEDDIDALWWSKEELDRIKRKAKSLCKILRKRGDCNTTDGKKTTFPLSMAHQKVSLILNADLEKLKELPLSMPDHDLHRWCIHNDGRRGLERFVSLDNSSRHRRDVIRLKQAVLKVQTRKLQQQRQCFTAAECDEESIAESSREITRCARTFALFLGAADALEANRIATTMMQDNVNNYIVAS